ncbi:MAG: hypothetical protein ACJ72N_07445 [Labedaea sp.]
MTDDHDDPPAILDIIRNLPDDRIAAQLAYHREALERIPADQFRLRRVTEANIRLLERVKVEREEVRP